MRGQNVDGELFCDLNCLACDAYEGEVGCLMFGNIVPMRAASNIAVSCGTCAFNISGFWKDKVAVKAEEMTPLKIPVFPFEHKC